MLKNVVQNFQVHHFLIFPSLGILIPSWCLPTCSAFLSTRLIFKSLLYM